MVPVISDGRFAAVLVLGQREWKRSWSFFIGDRNLLLCFFSSACWKWDSIEKEVLTERSR